MPVDVKYRTTATATGGRDGTARTDDGSFEVRLATPRELGGAGGDGNTPSSCSRPAMPLASSAR